MFHPHRYCNDDMIRALFRTNNLLNDAILLSVCGAITICSVTLCRDIALLSIAQGETWALLQTDHQRTKTMDKPLRQYVITVSIHSTSCTVSNNSQKDLQNYKTDFGRSPNTNSFETVHWPLTKPQIFFRSGWLWPEMILTKSSNVLMHLLTQ